MKIIPTGLLTQYESGQTSLAWFLRVTRTDAAVYGFTSAQRDVEISGVDYLAGPGLDVANLASTAGLAVDNTELTIVADDTLITVSDILAGRWDNAQFLLFRASWADTSLGIEVHSAGTFGTVQPRNGAYTVELRGVQYYLQQPVGSVSTKTCRARFADFPEPASDVVRCRLTAATYTVTGTLTGVTSQTVFTDTARTEAHDYFAEGVLTWTSGNNDGLSYKVKAYAADVFTLSVPPIGAVEVGDTYSVIAGCRKRLDEDCEAKFSNTLNFQGEPHRPTLDSLTEAPEVNVE